MVRLVFLLLLMTASFILSLLAFVGKGIILDDNYIFASKEARKSMDKRAYYQQSTIIFLLLGVLFLLYALRILLDIVWLTFAAIAIGVIAIVYIIISHYAIKKRQNK